MMLADLRLRVGRAAVRVQVEEVRVLAGDRSGPDVLGELSSNPPGPVLRGPAELPAALAGERVTLTAYHRRGSPDLSVTGVRIGGTR
jgi:hypothetical protein